MSESREKNGTRDGNGGLGPGEPTEPIRIKVEDRRHWAREDRDDDESEPATTQPTIVDQYRRQAEAAEAKLQEYIEAFKHAQAEHEDFRLRLERDVDRRVALKFGGLVADLLECMDDLDIAIDHVEDVPEAEPLAKGVALVRTRFLAALERAGVERIDVDGEEFDPNFAEAVRVDPVDDPELDGKVTESVRSGYRLGDRVLRPAQVAVGKLSRA